MTGEAEWVGPTKGQRVIQWGLIGLLVGLVAAILVLSCVPPVSRDELTHHLVVPKLYLAHGGIFEIPWIIFSYYPMNLDLLYMVPLALGSDIAPKFVHFSFALLTAGLLFRYLREKINVRYGLLGALAFLSIPVIVKLSVTAYVDLGLIFFSTATLLALLHWAETGFRWRHLMTAAVSCGLALGTKYNGLIVLFCTALMVPLLYVRGATPTKARQVKAIGMGAVFVTIAALVFSPWMIRDYVWTGNPVYPLYEGVFHPAPFPKVAPDSAKDGMAIKAESDLSESPSQPSLGHFRMRRLVYGESPLETLTTPLRIFFQGRDDDPQYFDGELNPILLILPLLAVLARKQKGGGAQVRDERALFGFAVLYLLVVFLQTDMRIRWISPIIPPLIILSMFGLHQLDLYASAVRDPIQRAVSALAALGAVIVFIGLNLTYLIGLFDIIRPWDYLGGKLTRDEYISKFRREYAVIKFANENLPKEARILAFYLGGRTYYSDRYIDCRYEIFFDALHRARSSDSLGETLREKGFSNIIIRMDIFQQSVQDTLGRDAKEKLTAFFGTQVRELRRENGYILLTLIKESE